MGCRTWNKPAMDLMDSFGDQVRDWLEGGMETGQQFKAMFDRYVDKIKKVNHSKDGPEYLALEISNNKGIEYEFGECRFMRVDDQTVLWMLANEYGYQKKGWVCDGFIQALKQDYLIFNRVQ